MADLVDRAYLELDGETIDCDKISWDIKGNKEARKAMNRKNRAIGHKKGVPDFEISATFGMDLDLETKFTKLLDNNTHFTVVVECESQGGQTQTFSFLDAVIYDISHSAQDGGVDIDLSITALDLVIT